jgi:hypothetical protein
LNFYSNANFNSAEQQSRSAQQSGAPTPSAATTSPPLQQRLAGPPVFDVPSAATAAANWPKPDGHANADTHGGTPATAISAPPNSSTSSSDATATGQRATQGCALKDEVWWLLLLVEAADLMCHQTPAGN